MVSEARIAVPLIPVRLLPEVHPAGYGGNVGAYLNTEEKVRAVLSRLQTAHRRAVQAEQCEILGKTEQAYEALTQQLRHQP